MAVCQVPRDMHGLDLVPLDGVADVVGEERHGTDVRTAADAGLDQRPLRPDRTIRALEATATTNFSSIGN